MTFGFINLHKPAGLTSHDCVARVRRILKTKRVGHGGTLDPLATGVLPIAVEGATRLLQFLPTAKVYRAVIRLGVTTTTDDLEGEIIQVRSASSVTLDRIVPALEQFKGTIQQIPPIYSAIQVKGKRLYELARQGEVVQPEPRTVEIYDIEVLNWQTHDLEYPELTVDITCGPGTYIRSIARDLGELLQTGGTLAQLIRTKSCGFDLEDSLTLGQLEHEVKQGNIPLSNPSIALGHIPIHLLDEAEAKRWCQGQSVAIATSQESVPPAPEGWVQVHDSSQFLGMGSIAQESLVPKVVLVTNLSE
jgi:tRNA pseudouridine55 synthase